MENNLIITGMPRAGTTLAAAMIDSMSDSVCLNEPAWQNEQAKRMAHNSSAAGFAQWLKNDFMEVRKKLLQGEPIMDMRGEAGRALTNYFPESLAARNTGAIAATSFSRSGLGRDFTLAIKHNGLYLGVLPELIAAGFKIIALVREPAAVIASWQKTPIPAQNGMFPAASIYWQDMYELTRSNIPLLEKQVRMADLIFKRLAEFSAHITILKYEELVKNPQLISRITGKENRFPAHEIKERNAGFYETDMSAIKAELLKSGKYYREFYPV